MITSVGLMLSILNEFHKNVVEFHAKSVAIILSLAVSVLYHTGIVQLYEPSFGVAPDITYISEKFHRLEYCNSIGFGP
jgi:hypothetical protein